MPPPDNSSMALIYIVNLNPIAKNHDGLIHKVNLQLGMRVEWSFNSIIIWTTPIVHMVIYSSMSCIPSFHDIQEAVLFELKNSFHYHTWYLKRQVDFSHLNNQENM